MQHGHLQQSVGGAGTKRQDPRSCRRCKSGGSNCITPTDPHTTLCGQAAPPRHPSPPPPPPQPHQQANPVSHACHRLRADRLQCLHSLGQRRRVGSAQQRPSAAIPQQRRQGPAGSQPASKGRRINGAVSGLRHGHARGGASLTCQCQCRHCWQARLAPPNNPPRARCRSCTEGGGGGDCMTSMSSTSGRPQP